MAFDRLKCAFICKLLTNLYKRFEISNFSSTFVTAKVFAVYLYHCNEPI